SFRANASRCNMGGAAAVGSGITATPSFRPEPESTELQISGSPFRSTSAHPAMTNQVISRCRLLCRGEKPCPRANYISVASEQTLRPAAHPKKRSKTHDLRSFAQPTEGPPADHSAAIRPIPPVSAALHHDHADGDRGAARRLDHLADDQGG